MTNSQTKIHHPLLQPGLLGILDPALAPNLAVGELVEAFIDGGAEPFIVRSPKLSLPDYVKLATEIGDLRAAFDYHFIVHNDIALAKTLGDCGVHLKSDPEQILDARDQLGKKCLIGYSAHHIEEAQQAAKNGADYLIFGAINPTPKSHDYQPVGIAKLAELCKSVEIPVYAIGGVNEENLTEIKQAGAFGFCALRAVYSDDQIEHQIAKLGFLWEDA